MGFLADQTNDEDEELQRALAASMESTKDFRGVTAENKDVTATDEEETSSKKPKYPPLPDEPKGDKNLLCRVGFRLPDGRRVQRNFFRVDPIQVRTILKLMLPCMICSYDRFLSPTSCGKINLCTPKLVGYK